MQSAETAPDDGTPAYLHIAQCWHALAEEAERLAPELREKGFREATEARCSIARRRPGFLLRKQTAGSPMSESRPQCGAIPGRQRAAHSRGLASSARPLPRGSRMRPPARATSLPASGILGTALHP